MYMISYTISYTYAFTSEMCAMISYMISCYEISNTFHWKHINKSYIAILRLAVLERKPPPSVFDQFLEAIQDTTLIILLVAAGLRILNLTFDWIACFANHLFAHLRLLLAARIGA